MFSTYALNGDQWSTPSSTLEGLWSSLGAGAEGLTLNIFLSSDNKIICAPDNELIKFTGVDKKVSDSSLADIQQLDAGACWRSIELNENGQPTGELGLDTPWVAPNDWQRLYFPELSLILQTFARRTQIQLILPSNNDIISYLIPQIEIFGLQTQVELIVKNDQQMALIKQQHEECFCVLDCSNDKGFLLNDIAQLDNYSGLYLTFEQLQSLSDEQFDALQEETFQGDFELYVMSHDMPYSFSHEAIGWLVEHDINVSAIVSKGSLPNVEALFQRGVVFADNFSGNKVNPIQWETGYSHNNDDTKITIDNALIIDIKQGGHYSGGAAIMKISTHGDFDAQVDFDVEHPHQGTTFELAAISIDPSYKSTNLTFDVHGAPPYASSERDEDDGFRCGWNNSFTVTDFISTSEDIQKAANSTKNYPLYGEPYSSNIYNCYGRDVGYGKIDSPKGQLRMVRHGQLFNSYYRDKFNKSWVCSGTMLVQNMPDDIFIRLAAKHWKKKNPEPPKNKVTFKQFVLKQY